MGLNEISASKNQPRETDHPMKLIREAIAALGASLRAVLHL